MNLDLCAFVTYLIIIILITNEWMKEMDKCSYIYIYIYMYNVIWVASNEPKSIIRVFNIYTKRKTFSSFNNLAWPTTTLELHYTNLDTSLLLSSWPSIIYLNLNVNELYKRNSFSLIESVYFFKSPSISIWSCTINIYKYKTTKFYLYIYIYLKRKEKKIKIDKRKKKKRERESSQNTYLC